MTYGKESTYLTWFLLWNVPTGLEKNIFGFPHKLLQWLKQATRSMMSTVVESIPHISPSSPWVRIQQTKQLNAVWSIKECIFTSFLISSAVLSRSTVTSKWNSWKTFSSFSEIRVTWFHYNPSEDLMCGAFVAIYKLHVQILFNWLFLTVLDWERREPGLIQLYISTAHCHQLSSLFWITNNSYTYVYSCIH